MLASHRFSTPMLLSLGQTRKIDPLLLITHRRRLDQILEAYETFGSAAKTQALKVIVSAWRIHDTALILHDCLKDTPANALSKPKPRDRRTA